MDIRTAQPTNFDGASWRRRLRRRLFAVLTPIVVAVAGAGYFAWTVIAGQRATEMQSWQTHLGTIAESRGDRISSWLSGHLDALEKIARDDAIGIYARNLARATTVGAAPDAATIAQRRYLENFLVVAAAQANFTPTPPVARVDANLPRRSEAGILILAPDLRVVAATADAPELDEAWRRFLGGLGGATRAVRGPFPASSGAASLGFAVAMPLASGPTGGAPSVGYVVGVKPVTDSFFGLLRQPGNIYRSLETYLVRRSGRAIEYLSPLADGTPPFALRHDADTPNLAARIAIETPGTFAPAVDYLGRPVLATGRSIPDGRWTLVQTIGRDEALGESDARLARNIVIGALLIVLIAGATVLIWRHAVSTRLQQSNERYRAAADRLLAERRLLRGVTDTVADEILIVDASGRIAFANRAVAARLAVSAEDMAGKTLAALIGPDLAARYLDLVRRAGETGRPQERSWRPGDETGPSVRTRVIPIDGSAEAAARFLVVDTDFTEIVAARERRERMLDGLIDGLVAMADRRDPDAGDQSARAARLASAVAEEMGLDAAARDVVRWAARLVNFYKILVPVDLLTRGTPLTPDERAAVARARAESVTLLSNVADLRPVCAALGRLDHDFDQGDGIARESDEARARLAAQIVALANAFIAMTSARAYRPRKDVDAAMAELADGAGKRFDPAVTAAFFNYMENRGGRLKWRR